MLNVISGIHSAGTPPDLGAYEAIATTTVGAGGSSSVTFDLSSVSGYKHLQIRISANVTVDSNLQMQVGNGSIDSGSNYSWHQIYGTGSGTPGTSSGANSSRVYFASLVSTSNIFGTSIIDILDYENTNKYKTFRALDGYDGNGSGVIDLASGNWRNTASIDKIKLFCAGNFTQYSSFALYGIKG